MAKSDSIQISFVDNKADSKSKTNAKKSIPKKEKKKIVSKKSTKNTNKSKRVVKKDRKKINIVQEDLDKLCEVYDWYISVKNDFDTIKKSNKNEKNLIVEKNLVKIKKSTTIVVDKEIWENFDTICKNSDFKKSEIITQALKDFILKHKDLY